MPEYDYIKYSSSGRPLFVRSQSFSHHHRPRHSRPRCPEDCACVPTEDWTNLVERERNARSANETLTRENRTLRSDLRTTLDEKHRLQDKLDKLRGHHSRDEDDASKFRRRLAALRAEVDSKDHALHDLKKADVRIRELTRTVSDKDAEISTLQDNVVLLKEYHKRDQHDLGVKTEELREAWSLVRDLQRQIRKYHDPFPFRRRYEFA